METFEEYLKLKSDTYEEAERFLYALPKFTEKRALSDTARLVKKLGWSHETVPMIHVAGTNGKGSTCAYLQKFLSLRKLQVATFVSPHLSRMTERFLLNGKETEDESFLKAYDRIRRLAGEDRKETGSYPTFFEFLFLMALEIFREKEAQVVIWETGLGGRLDATNVFSGPDIDVITAIGKDHCKYLGNTIEEIAWEKAGIIKNDSFVIYNKKDSVPASVIRKQILMKNARDCGLEEGETTILKINEKSIDFSYKSSYYNNAIFRVPSLALYQAENISLALRASECFFEKQNLTPLSEKEVQEAVDQTHWAGRMEEIAAHIFFDGAHNSHGIQAFIRCVSATGKAGNSLCFSVVNDKDYEDMVRLLCDSRLFTKVLAVEMPEERGLKTEELKKLFSSCPDWDVSYCDSITEAARWCKDQSRECASAKGDVYIVGSLYLVGMMRDRIKEEYV